MKANSLFTFTLPCFLAVFLSAFGGALLFLNHLQIRKYCAIIVKNVHLHPFVGAQFKPNRDPHIKEVRNSTGCLEFHIKQNLMDIVMMPTKA